MKKKKDPAEKPALDLLEEAVHLLRRAPLSVHLCYYMGAIPFVLGLLYFWSDMSRGAFAYDRIAGSSLELALLFVWMKCWQSIASTKLRAFLSASEESRWTVGRLWRLVIMQGALQPTALLLRIPVLSKIGRFTCVRAFYENAVILGDGSTVSLRELSGNASRLAGLWRKQNFRLQLWLQLFGIVVWLNVALLMFCMPYLLRMFTGIETAFTQSAYTIFNTTFLAISIGCTYLCVNPVTKAAYVLRCFYGESLHSGDDLRLGLRRAVAAAATALLLLICAPAVRADTAPPAPAAGTNRIKPETLDDSITRVLKRDEFAWRLPRQAAPDTSENFFSRFLDDVGRTVNRCLETVRKWWRQFLERWFRDRDSSERESTGSSMGDMRGVLVFMLWVVGAVVVLLLVWLIWANRHGFRRRPRLKAQTVAVVPDLNSEDVVASQLPEDEWLKMAREMIEQGELRLAIRALYLATLAHLGLRELISIARYKSNRDYQRELRRHAAGQRDLLNAFGESVSIFEEVWYGAHATTGEVVRQFSANIERIKVA